MNKDKAAILIIADASGSMDSIRGETVSSLNKFIREQKAVPGEAEIRIVAFNTKVTVIRAAQPIGEVREISLDEYDPADYTALLYAMGSEIELLGRQLAAMDKAIRPGRVVIVIITDGHENYPRGYTRERVMAMVEHQTLKYGWTFLFLGAGKDAIAQGGSLGVSSFYSMSYGATGQGIGNVYDSINNVVRSSRLDAEPQGFSIEDRLKNST